MQGLETSLECWEDIKNKYYGEDISLSTSISRITPVGIQLVFEKEFFSRQSNQQFHDSLNLLEDKLEDLEPEMIVLRLINSENMFAGDITRLREIMDVVNNYGSIFEKPIAVLDSHKFYDLSFLVGSDFGGFRFDGKAFLPRGGTNTPITDWGIFSRDRQEFIKYRDFIQNGPNIPYLPQTSLIVGPLFQLAPNRRTIMLTKHLSVSEGISKTTMEIRNAIINGNLRTYHNRVMQTSKAQDAQDFLN